MKIDSTVGAGSQNITTVGIQLSGKTTPSVMAPIKIHGLRLPMRLLVRSDHSPTSGSVTTSRIFMNGCQKASHRGFTAKVVV